MLVYFYVNLKKNFFFYCYYYGFCSFLSCLIFFDVFIC